MENAAAFFPPGADTVRVCAGQPVTDGIGQVCGQFGRLFFIIDACRINAGADLPQILCFLLEGDQLPPTVGSPVSPIKQYDIVFCIEDFRNCQISAADQFPGHAWKFGSCIKLLRHGGSFQ